MPAACGQPQRQYLLDLLDQIPDPRKRRGRRHRLAGLLAVGIAAVIAGSRSFAAIGQWAVDAGAEVLEYRPRFATSDKVLRSSQPFERWKHVIAGLIPEASGPMAQQARAALDQRKGLIEPRVNALADAATAEGPRWLHHIGAPPAPTNSAAYRDWLTCVATIVAYRDRYQITSDLPLGAGART